MKKKIPIGPIKIPFRIWAENNDVSHAIILFRVVVMMQSVMAKLIVMIRYRFNSSVCHNCWHCQSLEDAWWWTKGKKVKVLSHSYFIH